MLSNPFIDCKSLPLVLKTWKKGKKHPIIILHWWKNFLFKKQFAEITLPRLPINYSWMGTSQLHTCNNLSNTSKHTHNKFPSSRVVSYSVVVSFLPGKTRSWKFAVKFKMRYLKSFPRGYPSEAPLYISQAQQRKVSKGLSKSRPVTKQCRGVQHKFRI